VLTGVNDAIVNWFYGHNVVGLWFTTVGVGIAYYLLPQVTGKPLYSHKLSLIGFWTIAFTYVWTGTHHLLWGPVPTWTQYLAIVFSVLLIIPVWTVVWNFYKTIDGKWRLLAESVLLKFLVVAIFSYFLTCLQGPFQALRPASQYVHFTNWVVGHAHLALLSAFSFISFAAVYYILPRVSGRELYSWRRPIGTFGSPRWVSASFSSA
jgi:cbb3-type cytochrome c oxidase subunit I